MICFGFFLFSVSEHSFIMTASQKLFFARTGDDKVFVENSKSASKYLSKDKYPDDATKHEINELDKHRHIKIHLVDNIMLYFSRILGVFCSKCCFSKKDKLQRLYDEGEDKLSMELDIVKILKTIRDMKILVKGTLMNDEDTKFQVKHAPKNILNLDDTDESSSTEEEHNHDDHGTGLEGMANGEAPKPKDLRHALSSNIKKKKKVQKKKKSDA